MTDVKTWADGHGMWHALVELDYSKRDPIRAARMRGRREILAEVAQRQGAAPVVRVVIASFAGSNDQDKATHAHIVERPAS